MRPRPKNKNRSLKQIAGWLWRPRLPRTTPGQPRTSPGQGDPDKSRKNNLGTEAIETTPDRVRTGSGQGPDRVTLDRSETPDNPRTSPDNVRTGSDSHGRFPDTNDRCKQFWLQNANSRTLAPPKVRTHKTTAHKGKHPLVQRVCAILRGLKQIKADSRGSS